ncbi:PREDICTED: uncharacterized protein LOC106918289 [Poecilia mexicana]|uniref:uncharacterized protein LOC106918289 n=1 Tax=Poecilia mexicana TaxID=48701 RepID=UPI00072EAC06|nr:PREDICTED: uncharacterized protein LOC106918289 [Poecilia mexicana]
MEITMTVQKCVLLRWLLCTAVLHSVSAGGAYCAKTARARAAALGLAYPGVHGAPALSSPAIGLWHPSTFSFDDLPPTESNMNSYEDDHNEAPSDKPRYIGTHTRFPFSHGPFPEASRGQMADQILGVPRGLLDRRPESSLEEVNHVAPPTLVKAPSRPDPMNLHPQGRRKPFLFSRSKNNPAGDEFAPNRRGMPLTGHAPPLTLGHAAYQSGINPEVPLLHSARFFQRRHGWAPVRGFWKVVKRPGHLAKNPRRRLGVRPLIQGRAILQGLRKTK